MFESTHVPLNRWLLAFALLCSTDEGLSAHELHRSLEVTYKTASSMFELVRYAMSTPALSAREASGDVEQQRGRLSISLPFDEAVRAVLDVRPRR